MRSLLALTLLPVFLLSTLALDLDDSEVWEPPNAAQAQHFFGKHADARGSGSGHTNNWAVLVCASRYWFNYRVRTHSSRFIIKVLTIPKAHGQRPRHVRATLQVSTSGPADASHTGTAP